jgi:2-alkenal reductase
MNKAMPPSEPPPDPSESNQESFVLTPVNIARARHASAYGPNAGKRRRQSGEGKAKPAPRSKSANKYLPWALLTNSTTCLMSLVGIAFLMGGLLGGVVGGGVLLWANNLGIATLATSTPTPTSTPFPIPTPIPVDTPVPTPTPEPAPTLSTEDIIATALSSVVTIINQQQPQIFAPVPTADEGRVVGSGFIIDARGYIATNNHVVDHPDQLRVVLSDGREVTGRLIAANPAEDLAILKIDLPDLSPVEWGDSTKIRPGQTVYAIGSPLGDFPGSVSFGIVSGLNRALEIDKYVIDGLIQTDAAINRGSSGGPLINPQGQVVGLNTFIIRESEERGVAEGIAFAIPAETAKSFLIPWIAAHTGESVPIPVSGESN